MSKLVNNACLWQRKNWISFFFFAIPYFLVCLLQLRGVFFPLISHSWLGNVLICFPIIVALLGPRYWCGWALSESSEQNEKMFQMNLRESVGGTGICGLCAVCGTCGPQGNQTWCGFSLGTLLAWQKPADQTLSRLLDESVENMANTGPLISFQLIA